MKEQITQDVDANRMERTVLVEVAREAYSQAGARHNRNRAHFRLTGVPAAIASSVTPQQVSAARSTALIMS